MAITCQKCCRSLKEDNFYTYRGGAKAELCKQCMTMHVDNFDESTYLWILKKMDVPYVESEWNKIRDKAYAKNPAKMTGLTVIGKYLSLMKLSQYKNKTWADTEEIKAEEEKKKAQAAAASAAMKEQAEEEYAAGKITEAQYRTIVDTAKQQEVDKKVFEQYPRDPVTGEYLIPKPEAAPASPYLSEEELGNFDSQLTHDDKIYLALKWGRLYKADEWIQLEKNYDDMKSSFDIQDQNTENSLILLCKTNLKLNQCIDSGDLDGATKYAKMYDTLSKSCKFTAAQNKDKAAEEFDAVGLIVSFCEKEGGFIPAHDISVPKDEVDFILKDNQSYLKELIGGDPHIIEEIENYIKALKIQKQMKKDREDARAQGLEVIEVTNDDHEQYHENLRQQKTKDIKVMSEDGEDE